MAWNRELLGQFAGREALSGADLLKVFRLPAGVAIEDLHQALRIFVEEYGVQEGKLRPEDAITLFTVHPSTLNPILWLSYVTAYSDRVGELYLSLQSARKAKGRVTSMPFPDTLRDWVLSFACLDAAAALTSPPKSTTGQE